MTAHATARLILAAALLSSTAIAASAETLRWSRSSDSLTLDPHAQNEGPTHTLAHQVYEPLLLRDMTGEIEAALATDWQLSEDDDSVWVFALREGVTFHDGAAFTAEDVKFSIERAQSDNSAMKELLNAIVEVRVVDDHTVEFVTDGPNPILPANLTNLFMMDQGWAEENDAAEVQDIAGGESTFAATNANGTGPYRIASRQPDVRTVLERHEDYWGEDEFALGPTRIEFTPIQNAATRVAALLSGELDFIQDVPVQDLARVEGQEGITVHTTPQNRVIFLGMDLGADDLAGDSVEGENPFADVRVRQAMDLAIDRGAIQQVVMRGQSQPAGVIAPPFIRGWSEDLDAVTEPDLERARALLEEAGHGDGFTVTLDCPNDRYINDEAICQSVVGMLGRVGIRANLNAMTRSQFFPMVQNGETEFYLLGWGVPTYDSEYVFNFLVHTRGEDRGSWNATGFSDEDLDEAIRALSSETDEAARDAMVAEIWERVQEEVLYLPIHHQVLNWGMAERFAIDGASPEDDPKFKYFRAGA